MMVEESDEDNHKYFVQTSVSIIENTFSYNFKDIFYLYKSHDNKPQGGNILLYEWETDSLEP